MYSENGLVKLDHIIRSHIIDQGYSTLHKYVRYLHWGLDAVTKIWEGSGYGIVTKEFKVENLFRIYLPRDYIRWTKIAMKVGDRLAAFVPDNTISAGDIESESTFRKTVGADSPYLLEFMNYYNSYGALGSLYIHSSGHNGVGYFKVNEDKKYIQFESNIRPKKIWMEYVSNKLMLNTETLVPFGAIDIVKDYINWKEARQKFGDAHRETQARKMEYYESWHDFDKKESDLTLEGILDATTRTSSFSIKQR